MDTFASETNLIAQAQTGDLDAFNQLVLQYQDGLYYFAISLTHDPDLAEDVTQESFIKAFQSIGSFRSESFRSWLFKITVNTIRDIARQSVRRPTIPLYPKNEDGEEIDSVEWLIDPDQNVETVIQQNETADRLYQTLDALPEIYRSVLTLIDLQEMDYIEAAQVLGVPLGTIKSRLARARMHMKKMLVSKQDQPIPVTGSFTSFASSCLV